MWMCERRNTMLINKLNKYGENNNIEVKKEVPAEHKKYGLIDTLVTC